MSCFSSVVFLGLESLVTMGFHWVEYFSPVKLKHGYVDSENVTTASVDEVVSGKWVELQFGVNCLFNKICST